MQYKVCHQNEFSDPFGADIGIMIGDTLSPEFWILYMADFEIPPTADDIELMGMLISHLEQVDDLLLLALLPEGLQCKMDIFYQWCQVNFLIINAIKSGISYHGPAPAIMPVFRFGNSPVALLMEYVYVGMHFRTGNYRVFSSLIKPHIVEKAQKARKTAHAVLHVESMIGTLPVHEGKILYMGCVDPHLIYGCRVTLKTSSQLFDLLFDVQKAFFRHLLGLSKTSIKAAIFLETGIMPLQFCWLILALCSLSYFLKRPADTYVRAVLNESISLHTQGKCSWFGDLKINITRVYADILLSAGPDSDMLGDFTKIITNEALRWVESELERVDKRSYLLKLHQEPHENGGSKYCTMWLRQYLKDIQNAQHRKALTHLLSGDHPLAVVHLTWTDNHRIQVPHDERVCQFCKRAVETPEHALLEC
ncbi:hypothetical protein BT96DRAFT_751641, partial [Gymnopus androsaceus JB14]